MSVRTKAAGTYIRPLLFDHLQKVSVVHNPVKNRTQRESVVSAERGGEANDWYAVFDGSNHRVHGFVFNTFDGMRTLDARVEVRKDTTIGGRSGVVCLIYDNGL